QRSRNREDACARIRPRALPSRKGKVASYVDDPWIRRGAERECRVTHGCEIGKNPYLRHQVLQVSNIGQVRIRAWERSGIIVESPIGIVAGDGIVDEVLDDVSSRKRSCSRRGSTARVVGARITGRTTQAGRWYPGPTIASANCGRIAVAVYNRAYCRRRGDTNCHGTIPGAAVVRRVWV